MNITTRLFIVKYVFVINVDANIDVNLDKRENFDDANFEIIVAQNICLFDVANNVDSLELSVASKIKIVDEIKKVWIVASLFANEINSLKNEINTNFANFFWWWSCTCWCNLMLLKNLTKHRLQTKIFKLFFAIRVSSTRRACCSFVKQVSSTICCCFLNKRVCFFVWNFSRCSFNHKQSNDICKWFSYASFVWSQLSM